MSDDGYINREMLAERDAAVKMLDVAITRIESLEAALGKADGCANWCDALLEMVRSTSCEPDDPEAFDEVLMGAQMFLAAYRAAREEVK